MTGKHPKTQPQDRPRSDLDGGSTFQGDVENQTTDQGGVDPNRIGRTNK